MKKLKIRKITVRRKETPLLAVYYAGWNFAGQPVLQARCRCGWTHMTAYQDIFTAMQYLLNRYHGHYVSKEHKIV